jgi:predicted nucleic acid-binding protein
MPGGAERLIAVDTSVAVPLLVQTHSAHRAVVEWWAGRPTTLSGHALLETYSVLTRLPGDIRLDASDAARLLTDRFAAPLVLPPSESARLHRTLSDLGIAGGASYDAVVALAAAANNCMLATRDARARVTYEAVGVEIEIVG